MTQRKDHRMARRRLGASTVAALCLGATALAAAGCGSSGGGSTSGGSSGSAGATIGVSVPTVEGPFFTAMLYGIKDEAKKLGLNVKVMDAGGYTNTDQQVSQIQNLAVQQVKGMLVDPSDPTSTEGPIKDAVSQGIKVIGSGDPAPGALSSVSASHCAIGKAMAVGAKKLLPHGGTMAVLAGPAGATWSTARLKCFKQAIAGSGIVIKAEKTSDPAVDQGVTIASDFLQRYPNLDLLYGADDTVGVGAAKAVQAANRCGKTQVLTAVLGTQAEQLLKKGCISYDVAQQTVKIGRVAVQTVKALMDGKKVAPDIQIPLVPVTKANVAEVNLATIREPGSGS
jgi:ABC-type sugar transport system substrate-binding protein